MTPRIRCTRVLYYGRAIGQNAFICKKLRWRIRMRFYGRTLCVALFIGLISLVSFRVESSTRQTQAPALSQPAQPVQAIVDKYCITCHSQRLHTAGLTLENVDATKPAANPETWERVIAKLRAGSMPPVGRPRPDVAA